MTQPDAVDLGPDPVSPVADPHPRRPDLRLPAGSWDMHCHVFGPPDRFPYAAGSTPPPDAGVDRLLAVHEVLGLQNALIVQSAVHGTDHRALVDALAAGAGRHRGVALLDLAMTDDQFADLDDAGVRGLRLNFLPHLGGAPSPEVFERAVEVVRRHGWHLEIHVAGGGIIDNESLLAALDVPVVIDHMARFDVTSAHSADRMAACLRLLSLGHVWMKVSGVDRLSVSPPPFQDAVEVARTFVAEAPERTLWGTDFPHPNSTGWTPSDAARVEQLAEIAPGDDALRRLLVDNPRAFLGLS